MGVANASAISTVHTGIESSTRSNPAPPIVRADAPHLAPTGTAPPRIRLLSGLFAAASAATGIVARSRQTPRIDPELAALPWPQVRGGALASRLADSSTPRGLDALNWQQLMHDHPDVLTNLSADYAIPFDNLQAILGELIQDIHRDPARKENHEFDIYAMPLNAGVVTIAAKVEGGKVRAIASPSLLNGLSTGFDKVMSKPLNAATVNLRSVLPASRFVKVPLKAIPGKIAWVNWPLLEQSLMADDNMSSRVRDALQQCCRDRNLTPELSAALLSKYGYMVDTTHNTTEEGASSRTPATPEKTKWALPKRASALKSLYRLKEAWQSKSHAAADVTSPSSKLASPVGFADRYNMGKGKTYRGSGRAVMTEFGGGAFIKGCGPTPLRPVDTGTHSTGMMSAEEAVVEAVGGEVLAPILDNRTTRILLLIAPDVKENETNINSFLAVRVGNHLRPGNFNTEEDGSFFYPTVRNHAMERMYPDRSPEERVRLMVAAHATLAARMAEYRFLHGSPDLTNLGMPGSALDFGTLGTIPHTGPSHNLAAKPSLPPEYLFGGKPTTPHFALQSFFEVSDEVWNVAFRRAKNVETLGGCGIPSDLAEKLVDEHPRAHDVAKAIRRLGRWFHDDVSSNGRQPYQRSSILDRHRLQSQLCSLILDGRGGIKVPTRADLMARADPYFDRTGPVAGEEESWRKKLKFQKYAYRTPVGEDMGTTEKIRDDIDQSLDTIIKHFPTMIAQLQSDGLESGRWETPQRFADCLSARAMFQNRPIDAINPLTLRGRVKAALARQHTKMHDSRKGEFLDELSDIIESSTSESKRRVDDLLFNTPVSTIRDASGRDVHRLQLQKLGGYVYYLEATSQGHRRVCVEIPLSRLTETQQLHLEIAGADGMDLPWKGEKSKLPGSSAHCALRHSDILGQPALVVSTDVRAYQYGSMVGDLTIGGEGIAVGKGISTYHYIVPDRHELTRALHRR